jgi:hypothetical protein
LPLREERGRVGGVSKENWKNFRTKADLPVKSKYVRALCEETQGGSQIPARPCQDKNSARYELWLFASNSPGRSAGAESCCGNYGNEQDPTVKCSNSAVHGCQSLPHPDLTGSQRVVLPRTRAQPCRLRTSAWGVRRDYIFILVLVHYRNPC